MQRSLLELYMSKVAGGELSFLERLCLQLMDRLVFIPVLDMHREGTTASVDAVRITINNTLYVPTFTSERRFAEWRTTQEEECQSISLLGGDLCAALERGIGVVVDPGAQNSVRLQPDTVAEIAEYVLSEAPAEPPPFSEQSAATEEYTFNEQDNDLLGEDVESEPAADDLAEDDLADGVQVVEDSPADSPGELMTAEERTFRAMLKRGLGK